MPNKPVKGTRRPLAVLKFGFYQGSVASLKLSERRAPYRNVGQPKFGCIGFSFIGFVGCGWFSGCRLALLGFSAGCFNLVTVRICKLLAASSPSMFRRL